MNPVVFLPLSQGKIAVIDFDDFEKVGRVKWSAMKRPRGGFYAFRKMGNIRRWLHREILGAGPVDHRNNDGLNNRRENLRLGGPVFNMRAARRKSLGKTSKFRGVSLEKGRRRWRADIKASTGPIFLGRFGSEISAAQAYDEAAIQLGFPIEALNFSYGAA